MPNGRSKHLPSPCPSRHNNTSKTTTRAAPASTGNKSQSQQNTAAESKNDDIPLSASASAAVTRPTAVPGRAASASAAATHFPSPKQNNRTPISTRKPNESDEEDDDDEDKNGQHAAAVPVYAPLSQVLNDDDDDNDDAARPVRSGRARNADPRDFNENIVLDVPAVPARAATRSGRAIAPPNVREQEQRPDDQLSVARSLKIGDYVHVTWTSLKQAKRAVVARAVEIAATARAGRPSVADQATRDAAATTTTCRFAQTARLSRRSAAAGAWRCRRWRRLTSQAS